MSEPISPGKVGNHYRDGNGHGRRFRLLRLFQNASSTSFAGGASNRGTIGSYVSVASYDGRLRNSPEMAALRSPLPWPFNRNLTWLTIRGREKKGGSGKGTD